MGFLPALVLLWTVVLTWSVGSVDAFQQASLEERIDAWVLERMAARGISGVAVAVVQGGETVHLRGYGVADPTGRQVGIDTPFLIGSLSKPFTAHVVRQLVDEGLLSLDEPVLPYLAHLVEELPDGFERMTVRHLLTHTGGIATNVGLPGTVTVHASDDALQRRVGEVLVHSLSSPPGERYAYSNAGYALLASVVENVTGAPFQEVLQGRVFRPVGMADTFADDRDRAAATLAVGHRRWFGRWWLARLPFDPAGVAYGYIGSSARDLARFMQAHLADDAGLVPASAGQVAQEPVLPTGWDIPLEAGQGLGWMVDELAGLKVVSHAGSLPHFTAHLIMVPDADRLGIAVLTNASAFVAAGHEGQYEISLGLAELMLGMRPTPAASGTLLALVVPIAMSAVAAILIALVARDLVLDLRRWRPVGAPGVGSGSGPMLRLLLPSVVYLALGAGLYLAIPLGAARLFYPDVGWAATVIAYLAMAWGVVRPLVAVVARLVLTRRPRSLSGGPGS